MPRVARRCRVDPQGLAGPDPPGGGFRDTLVLAVPDEFVKEWIEQYTPTVVSALGRVAGRPLDIRVTVGPLEDTGDEEQLRRRRGRPPTVPC